MAEGVLFDLAGELLGGLASLACQELGLAWGVKAEISKLNNTVSLIKGVLRDAEEQQRNNHGVTVWLGQLKDVVYDVDDLLDDFSTEALRRKIMRGNEMVKEVRIFFSKSNQLAYRLKMGHRVKDIRERLDNVAADKDKFVLINRPVESLLVGLKERDQTHSSVREKEIIGRDDDKKKIVKLLLQSELEENVSIVPIIGIGGLGKTTLAKMVFNDENVGKHFQLKMWVCVSEKFEIKVIVEKIIEAATKKKPVRDLQMETLQDILRENINGKKYLLVLDDVWNEDREKWLDLRNLLLDGARGSWIVITTRNRGVAEITGTVSPHELEGLSKGQSWSLLKQMAFKEQSHESNSSHFEAIGMEIVEKCKGVPLALRAIGSVLFKRTEAEWLKVKNNIVRYITRTESSIMPILKLSYDHLPPHLRQCFAYCSLIPKDMVVEVKFWILLWMHQGFLQPQSGDEDLEDVGLEYFMNLLWRSFFEVAEEDDSGNVESFTMHDLMHDLACFVAGTECCIAGLEAENVDERTRHVIFEDKADASWKIPSTLLKANRLRTISLPEGSLNQSNCNALISNFRYLRFLNLSDPGIERLPHSIGKLKHLRGLYLTGNENIKKLPSSLCRLQNLQTLRLSGCSNLAKLPRKTRRLVSLRYLSIDGCDSLAYMPRGLGQLTCLRTLNEFIVGKRGKGVGELRELNGLKNLEGKIRISSLKNAIPEPGPSHLKEKLNLKHLKLSWSDEEEDASNEKSELVFERLQPHPNLKKLRVNGYPGSKISSWLSSITNLTQLILEDCVECKHLPPLHQLSSLKILKLLELKALENVSEIEMQKELSSSKSTKFFPSLEKLQLEYCPNLKGWWRGNDDEASNAQLPCFPCLSDLAIRRCPNLTSMPLFPSVRELRLKETSWKQLQETMKLKMTTSEEPSSSSSSSLFPPFSKLTELRLEEMEDLDSLPEEFLQNLTSLRFLSIRNCSNLTSMPKGMRFLTSLQRLQIDDCPQLWERCQRDIGVDWPNIAHIGDIWIGWHVI
ncbi:putative disease resistance protein RGA4 [Durio zibethinus]|uniref:Disease resistance protein RGA4 n=1 Tax=Durio zibethinus TaxID=66656 RepID=A0A6P5X170_DURZI|nr:putative disease resistance protein RGA4 [Durio zibethinus]